MKLLACFVVGWVLGLFLNYTGVRSLPRLRIE